MPTILSHAVAATALVAAFPERAVPRRAAVLGAICAMAPDADVAGFAFGVEYGDLLGHRGLSHSLVFAAVLAAGAAWVARRSWPTEQGRAGWLWLYLFLATASHGLLDALTDGGLGVAFFSPFDPARYFFPWTPIAVSPIGAGFFSRAGVETLLSELRWVWLPSAVLTAVAVMARRALGRLTTRER